MGTAATAAGLPRARAAAVRDAHGLDDDPADLALRHRRVDPAHCDTGRNLCTADATLMCARTRRARESTAMQIIDGVKRQLHRDIAADPRTHGWVLNLYLNGERYPQTVC